MSARELSNAELDQMAMSVREELETKFGKSRVAAFFKQDGAIANELLFQTFLVVRNKLS